MCRAAICSAQCHLCSASYASGTAVAGGEGRTPGPVHIYIYIYHLALSSASCASPHHPAPHSPLASGGFSVNYNGMAVTGVQKQEVEIPLEIQEVFGVAAPAAGSGAVAEAAQRDGRGEAAGICPER
jgi:hypothetical protein